VVAGRQNYREEKTDLAALPRTPVPLTCPKVVVIGDFFTRFSPFFMDGIRDLYAERGIILKPADLSDLLLYFAYDELAEWPRPG